MKNFGLHKEVIYFWDYVKNYDSVLTDVRYRYNRKLLDWVVNFAIWFSLKYKEEFEKFVMSGKEMKGVLTVDKIKVYEPFLKYAKDIDFLSKAVNFVAKEVLKIEQLK